MVGLYGGRWVVAGSGGKVEGVRESGGRLAVWRDGDGGGGRGGDEVLRGSCTYCQLGPQLLELVRVAEIKTLACPNL